MSVTEKRRFLGEPLQALQLVDEDPLVEKTNAHVLPLWIPFAQPQQDLADYGPNRIILEKTHPDFAEVTAFLINVAEPASGAAPAVCDCGCFAVQCYDVRARRKRRDLRLELV